MERMGFEIYRYNPDVDARPYMQRYGLELKPTDVKLLDALVRLKARNDTLSFHRSCREGICGSDGMSINSKNGLACLTDLRGLKQPVKIRPLPGLPVIRDLIANMTQFFKQYHSIKPYVVSDNPIDADKERLQTQEERKELDGLYECILCACCSAAYPSFWWNPDKSVGPSGLLNAYRFIVDNRDTITNERLDNLSDPYRLFRCHTIMNCIDVYPRHLDPTRATGKIKEIMLKRAVQEMMVFDDIAKRKVHFQTRRGLLELDLIFGRFMEKESEHLSDGELTCLVEILALQDQELLSLINGSRTTDKAHLVPMLEKIRRS